MTVNPNPCNAGSGSPAQLSLTTTEAREVWNLAETLEGVDPLVDTEEFLFRAEMASDLLPERLRVTLRQFGRFGHPSGGLLISGLPTGPVPATPADPSLGIGVTLPASRVMSVVAPRLGSQYGFRGELGGLIVQDICPVEQFKRTQRSISNESLLILHCETVFTEHRADCVALFGLRDDHNGTATTLLAAASRCLARLDPDTIEVLRQYRFSTTVDESFLAGAAAHRESVVGPIQVLGGSEDRPRVRADFNETHGLDEVAAQALHALWRAASATATHVRVTPGTLLLIDNHASFHGRGPFNARYDGTDRWLLRTFITRDLSRSVVARPADGRVVFTINDSAPSVPKVS